MLFQKFSPVEKCQGIILFFSIQSTFFASTLKGQMNSNYLFTFGGANGYVVGNSISALKYPPSYNVSGGPNIPTRQRKKQRLSTDQLLKCTSLLPCHLYRFPSSSSLTVKPSTGSFCNLLYSSCKALIDGELDVRDEL